ncbi:MAG: CpsB/CapC family capsule biosynthesis tyrosine phosphatase [Myxococcota bacterium]|nr:CpsB/CapC family capsule biosynthesis tyrosine phosphatase [Myxococcota bacterium]
MRFLAEEGYCDLHLHAVPNIDDGARSMEAALDMLKGLHDLGYRHFVVTPHADDHRFTYSLDLIRMRFQRLQEAVAAAGLPIDLDCGAEYTYGERLRSDIENKRVFTLAGSRYVLMELPEAFIPATMPSTLYGFARHDVYPVLAHPERCRPFQDDPEALERLATGRALVQVSFRSLAGTFGRTIKKTAWRLVEEDIADLVATDCHSPRDLKKVVQPVLKALNKRLDPSHFHRLMISFPKRMVDGNMPS